MTSKFKKTTKAFIIMTVVLLLASLINWGVISGWGNTEITRIKLVGDNGMEYSALVYVPKNATNETPAPVLLMVHGNSGNARNHESWAVEFTRRGFVCVSVDTLGGGDGEFSTAVGSDALVKMFADYVMGMGIVDKERIVVAGHSAGGGTAFNMACRMNAAIAMLSDNGPGAFRSETPFSGSLLFLSGDADNLNNSETYSGNVTKFLSARGFEIDDPVVQSEKTYSNPSTGSVGEWDLVPGQIHEGPMTNNNHIVRLLTFVQSNLEVPNYIDANDTIWLWKDIIGMICMFIFAAWAISLALLIIDQVPFFASIKNPMPRNIGMRGASFGISAFCALLFPFVTLLTGAFGLINALGGAKDPMTGLFRVRFTNVAFPIVVVLNILGLIMFFVFHYTWGKKKFNATIEDYGLTSPGKNKLDFVLIGKALLLAVCVIFIAWNYLDLQGKVLGTDFYSFFFGFKPIAMNKLIYYIPYMIGWAICFAIASLGMNVERRLPSTGNETKDTVIAMAVNSVLAFIVILAVVLAQIWIQRSIGSTATAMASWKTDLTRIWGMPVGMCIGAMGNTYLYRKTGNVWLGAILMGFIAALVSCLYGQVRF